MALTDVYIPRRDVPFRDTSFSVRGLSLIDVSALMQTHLEQIDHLFKLYDADETREQALGEAARFGVTIVRETPSMVGLLIALAADEPSAVEKANRLPLAVQVEALRNIIELTFEEAGGAKKFLDMVVEMVRGMMPKRSTD